MTLPILVILKGLSIDNCKDLSSMSQIPYEQKYEPKEDFIVRLIEGSRKEELEKWLEIIHRIDLRDRLRELPTNTQQANRIDGERSSALPQTNKREQELEKAFKNALASNDRLQREIQQANRIDAERSTDLFIANGRVRDLKEGLKNAHVQIEQLKREIEFLTKCKMDEPRPPPYEPMEYPGFPDDESADYHRPAIPDITRLLDEETMDNLSCLLDLPRMQAKPHDWFARVVNRATKKGVFRRAVFNLYQSQPNHRTLGELWKNAQKL